jgi:hypothetical protein
MMHDVVLAVRIHVGQQDIVGEPGSFEIVELQVVGQQSVRRIVREHGEPELTRADNRDRKEESDRVRPPYEHRHRGEDHHPRVEDQPCAAQVGLLLERYQFFGSENVASGEHAILQSSIGGSIRAD